MYIYLPAPMVLGFFRNSLQFISKFSQFFKAMLSLDFVPLVLNRIPGFRKFKCCTVGSLHDCIFPLDFCI